jgi:hypothetical protein
MGSLEDSSPASGEHEHNCSHCKWVTLHAIMQLDYILWCLDLFSSTFIHV